MKALPIPGQHNSKGRFAETPSPFQHRIEDRSEVSGRGIDDLQDLGGRGLLLQGLARLSQEPRVLHRDHRLRRKVLQERDLLVAEWPHLPAASGDGANQCFLFAEGYRKRRPAPGEPGPLLPHGVGKIGLFAGDISNLHYAVELWNIGGATKALPEPISACRHGGGAFQKCTAAPHDGSSCLALFRSEHAVL